MNCCHPFFLVLFRDCHDFVILFLWFCDFVISWFHDFMVLGFCFFDFVILWFNDCMISWFCYFVFSWFYDCDFVIATIFFISLFPRFLRFPDFVILWFHDFVILWFNDLMILWFFYFMIATILLFHYCHDFVILWSLNFCRSDFMICWLCGFSWFCDFVILCEWHIYIPSWDWALVCANFFTMLNS